VISLAWAQTFAREIGVIADCTTEGSRLPMRQISLHRLVDLLRFSVPQTPASICEKSSHCMRKFEGLRCGARDAIIDMVRPG
jgi:hypothetical protein